jgi:FHS family L-fucose permease-like MFS transporter
VWGILRSLDDILVAIFHASGSLHYATAMLIHFSFFSAYLLMSIPAGIYVERCGYVRSLTAALLLMALGSAICVPVALLYSFPLCLVGIFVMALGIAALQTAANPYIGVLGPEEHATARLLIVQSFSSLGSVLGPMAGTMLFGTWSRHGSPAALVFPARLLSVIYLLLTLCLMVLMLLRRNFVDRTRASRGSIAGAGWQLLRHRRPLFGASAVFLYVGSEATLLGHSIPYLSGHYTEGFLPGTAAGLLSVYWLSMLAGRIFAVSLLKGIDTRTVLQGACLLAFVFIQVALYHGGAAGGICLLCTGLCNAVMFPSIFSLSVAGLREEDLPQASALLSTAICGGAVMPVLSSLLAERFGIAVAFLLPSLAYVFIGLCSSIFFPRDYHLQRLPSAEKA